MKIARDVLLLVTIFGAGCATDQVTKKRLEESRSALEQRQYDLAISRADAVLNNNPNTQDAAALYYIRGRALEQRDKPNPSAAASDLALAKIEYQRALQLAPPKKLEGYIRTSLANVAFFLDDYALSLQQWGMAYNLLEEPDLKAWTLYRHGLSQQRLGLFKQADATFTQVQHHFPNTDPAARAREHEGATNFQVQLATFSNPRSADAAVTELKSQGYSPIKSIDARGLTTLRVGPAPTYAEAVKLKQKFVAQYSDAIILP